MSIRCRTTQSCSTCEFQIMIKQKKATTNSLLNLQFLDYFFLRKIEMPMLPLSRICLVKVTKCPLLSTADFSVSAICTEQCCVLLFSKYKDFRQTTQPT